VCEQFWTLPPGRPCPKHEVELGAWEGSLPAEGEVVADQRWVTIARFGDALRAEAPRIRLEAEGIPTFVDCARMGSPSMYHVATGGVKLQVPESLAADARVLLAQTWSADSDDLDDAWDDLAPDSGARWRDLGRLAMLFVLLAPLFLSLATIWLAWLAARP
jgi:hypothetical protein